MPWSLLSSLWSHRNLLWQMTLRNVELRHKGSHLGLIWSVLSPLLMLALYVLVFGYIFNGKLHPSASESRIEYALVVFLGLAIYHFVAEILSVSPILITSNPNLVKKVVFPLEILPVAGVAAAGVHFAITLVLVFVGALVCGVPVTAGVFLLPVILVPLFALAVGLALLLSALGVFWRDIAQVTQFVVLALMFASAVFYPVTQIPETAWTFLRFNPLLQAINEARAMAFWGEPLHALRLGYLYLCSLLVLGLGHLVFQRLRSSFADVL